MTEILKKRKNIIIDGTVTNLIQNCPYKLFLAQEMNLRPNVNATPLEEGDLLHKMLEDYYKSVNDNPMLVLTSSEYEATVQKSVEVGEEHGLTQELLPAEQDEVMHQFREVTKHYRNDGWKIIEVERPFIKELYQDEDLRILYTGKIDLIVEDPQIGICVVDHKKTKRNERPSTLSNQFTGYSWATEIQYVIVNKVGFQKTLTPEERFKRHVLFYTEDMWNQWVTDTIWWGKMYAYHIEEGVWPRNLTSCDKYGGCIYQRICEAGTEEGRAAIINTEFKVGEHWDPTKVLALKEIT